MLLSTPQNNALLEDAVAALLASHTTEGSGSLKAASSTDTPGTLGDPEQNAFEKELVERFRVALVSPLPNTPSPVVATKAAEGGGGDGTAKEAAVESSVPGVSADTDDSASAAPVLLLEPAALSAASTAP